MKNTVLSLTFTDLPLSLWEKKIRSYLSSPAPHAIYTPNAEIAHRAQTDCDFCALLMRADALAPDGDGVILGGRLSKKTFRYGKRAGVALGIFTAKICAENGKSLFLFGGKEGVAKRAAIRLKKRFPDLIIAGTACGYGFDSRTIARQIKESGADAVLVCLGSPMQERWIDENKQETGASLLFALGGSLDVYAGDVRRAPKIWRVCKAEWLWRLIKDPTRLGRMRVIPKYLFLCARNRNAKNSTR